MKLASLRKGGRDGSLIVVNRAMTHAASASAIAPTLQSAMENWDAVSPLLAELFDRLQQGGCDDSFPLRTSDLASPLPRSYQFLDGSVYLHHMEKARKARGASMPVNYKTEPLMYQGMSDSFCGPNEVMRFPSSEMDADYEAEVAVVIDDVPMGTTVAEAGKHIKLIMLLNDYTLRALTKTELPKGFGFMQAKPTSAFSPVAVTPDELGAAWDGSRLSLRLVSSVNGRRMGQPNAGVDMFFTYPQLIAHAARTRCLGAGTIIGAGSVSNQDEAAGFGCIAEARIHEQMTNGTAQTRFLQHGDTVRIEMCDAQDQSVFGAIEQTMEIG